MRQLLDSADGLAVRSVRPQRLLVATRVLLMQHRQPPAISNASLDRARARGRSDG